MNTVTQRAFLSAFALLLVGSPSCDRQSPQPTEAFPNKTTSKAVPTPAKAAAPPAAEVTPAVGSEDAAPSVATPPFEPIAPEKFTGKGFNLICISLTNTRADHLGVYGYERPTSPHLDRLAEEGLVFESAFSHASWTLPVVVSLLTSVYPFTHGLMNRRSFQPLAESVPTLIDVMKEHGYLTAAFVGDRDYGTLYGHTSRFDVIRDSVNASQLTDWKQYGVLRNSLPAALEWLRKNRDRKFFLLLQGYDTHCPFGVPEVNDVFDPDYDGETDFTSCYWTFKRTKPITLRAGPRKDTSVYLLKTKPADGDDYEVMFYPEDVHHMVALYDGEIQNADLQLHGLFREVEELGLSDKTIIVFFSDHGDMFGKYGRFMRGGPLRGTFYDNVLRIPLVIKHPTLPPRRIEGIAQVIDLAPTLLDMLGIEPPQSFRGKSLRPLILRNEVVNTHTFAGSAFSPRQQSAFFRHDSIIVSVRSQARKLILEKLFFEEGAREFVELFDLETDPEELQDLAPSRPQTAQKMKGEIEAWLKTIQADEILTEIKK